MNCWSDGGLSDTFPGVKAMDVSVACGGGGPDEVTVKVAVALTPLKDAVIVDCPAAIPVASPGFDWPIVSIVTEFAFEEAQVAVLVTSWLEPSEYLPVATNCNWPPTPVEEVVGFSLILVRVGWPDPVDPEPGFPV